MSDAAAQIPGGKPYVQTTRAPTVHRVKIHRDHMACVWRREKTAELRFDDRDYRIGDTLQLCQWGPRAGYSGREVSVQITHITRLCYILDTPVDNRWVMLSFKFTGGTGG